MTDRDIELVRSIYRKTEEKKAEWESSSRDDQFVLNLKNGTIMLTKYRRRPSDFEGGQPPYYKISVLNTRGERVKELHFESGNEEGRMVDKLFEIIKSQYFDTEGTLAKILTEVQESSKIGGEDDLPF
jgi:hypothetical protein